MSCFIGTSIEFFNHPEFEDGEERGALINIDDSSVHVSIRTWTSPENIDHKLTKMTSLSGNERQGFINFCVRIAKEFGGAK